MRSVVCAVLLTIFTGCAISCGKKSDPFLECIQTKGRRPCEPNSMKYDEGKGLCGCNTKHRGWIVWGTKKR